MKNLLVIGTGGHARPVVDIAQLMGFNVLGCIDINFSGNSENILGVPVIGGMEELAKHNPNEISAFIAIGDNKQRAAIRAKLHQLKFKLTTLIHPSVIKANDLIIGSGSLICAGAILNPKVEIGECCILNTGVIIDHETKIDNCTHIAPGVKIAGRAKIGQSVFVGIGSVIIDKIVVGNNAVIGAGSIILDHVTENTTVVGLHKKLK